MQLNPSVEVIGDLMGFDKEKDQLPSQHPANDLIEGDRFERALAEAQAPHSSSDKEPKAG